MNVEHEIAKGVWLKKMFKDKEETKTQLTDTYTIWVTVKTSKRVQILAKF